MMPLLAILLASLLGSLHCAGMCGAFVAFAVGMEESKWRAQVAYHGGRLVTYAALGALAGGLGHLLNFAAKQAQFQHAAAWIAGGVMVLTGVLLLLQQLGRGSVSKPPAFLVKFSAAGHRLAAPLSPARRALVIGLITFLLPCGWLWQFVIAASATGSALGGACLMAAFWLGTVPILAGMGFGVKKLLGAMGARLSVLGAVLIIALGVWMAFSRGATDFVPWVKEKVEAKDARAAKAARDAVMDEDDFEESPMPMEEEPAPVPDAGDCPHCHPKTEKKG